MENIPIYVKIDRYKELLEVLQKLETKLQNVNKMIDDINALKDQEDAEVRKWNENLTDVKERLGRIRETFYQQ